MKIKRFETNDMIFVEKDIGVIADGIVHMKSHSENILPPKLMAKLKQGDVLGYEKADDGISVKVETWYLVKAPTEIIFFDPRDFDFIWSQHRQNHSDMMVKIL